MVLGYTGRGTGANTKSGIGKLLQLVANSKKYDVYLFADNAQATKMLTADLEAHLLATKGAKCRTKIIIAGHSFGATRAISVGKWFSTTASKLVPSVWHEVHVISIDAIKDTMGNPTSVGWHKFTTFVNLYQTQGKQEQQIGNTICGGPISGATNRRITLLKGAIPKGDSPHTAIDEILSVPLSRYVNTLARGGCAAVTLPNSTVSPVQSTTPTTTGRRK